MKPEDYALRLAVALLAGLIIGGERQLRHKIAGLKTNSLVALGACLFCLVGADRSDPTGVARIAGQIASGIGFLGAGVILREGLNVRGLDTAATLWCSASVGALAGSGYWPVTLGGAALIVLVNLFLHRYNAKYEAAQVGAPMGQPQYEIMAVCSRSATADLTRWLVTTVESSSFMLEGMKTEPGSGLDQERITVVCRSGEWRDVAVEKLVAGLSLERGVTEASWRRVPGATEVSQGSPF
jgi:putative Mg2+ transporter-C (MgtC) family protein